MNVELVPLANAVALPYSAVYPDPNQPRQFFDEAKIAELRESITAHGIQQPLIVRYEPSAYDGKPYKLVAGGRRYLASEGLLDVLPCIIQNVDEANAAEIALTENIQREDLTPLEEANALRAMMTRHNLSSSRAAKRLGVTTGWVDNRLGLLKSGKDVQAVAKVKPKSMSSLLLIEKVKEPELRSELLEEVKADAPFTQIKSRVDAHESAVEAQKKADAAANRAPDSQTQSRIVARSRGESSSMSRGKRTSAATERQANEEVRKSLANIKAWLPLASDAVYKEADELARSINRGPLNRK